MFTRSVILPLFLAVAWPGGVRWTSHATRQTEVRERKVPNLRQRRTDCAQDRLAGQAGHAQPGLRLS
jgi:hypothetical protein